MKLRAPYEIMQVEEQSYAVPMEDNGNGFNGMVKLSKTAAAIFKALREETCEEVIVEDLVKRFDAPRDVIAADVHGMVELLKEKGLLT